MEQLRDNLASCLQADDPSSSRFSPNWWYSQAHPTLPSFPGWSPSLSSVSVFNGEGCWPPLYTPQFLQYSVTPPNDSQGHSPQSSSFGIPSILGSPGPSTRKRHTTLVPMGLHEAPLPSACPTPTPQFSSGPSYLLLVSHSHEP